MIAWTLNVEENFTDDEGRRIESILDADPTKELTDLVKVIRDTDLTPVDRKKLTALITHEVHNRDIIEDLIANNIQSTDNFAWKKCLRYYFEEE